MGLQHLRMSLISATYSSIASNATQPSGLGELSINLVFNMLFLIVACYMMCGPAVSLYPLIASYLDIRDKANIPRKFAIVSHSDYVTTRRSICDMVMLYTRDFSSHIVTTSTSTRQLVIPLGSHILSTYLLIKYLNKARNKCIGIITNHVHVTGL